MLENTSSSTTPRIENLIYKNKINKFVLDSGENKEVSNPPHYFTSVNGEDYISADALSGPYSVVVIDGEVTFKNAETSYTFSVSESYEDGIDSFTVDGRSVYKLSKLGLKAPIQENTLVIEE